MTGPEDARIEATVNAVIEVSANLTATAVIVFHLLDTARKADPEIDARILGSLDTRLGQLLTQQAGLEETRAQPYLEKTRARLITMLKIQNPSQQQSTRMTLRRRFLNWLQAA
jgi:hypothetical protein